MKTISQQKTLFGDFYYNSSRKELVDLANFLNKYSLDELSDYLKVIMQDILAHMVGSTSFMDACMVKDKLNYEAIINTRIGKKKLVEFLSLLEELDKLGIHLDEVTFNKNQNDLFLEKAKNNIATYRGINLDYLAFNNLDEFWEMIIMAVTLKPMARNKESFNALIPDPSNFDFKNNYYETIDYLLYYQDRQRLSSMMDKHSVMGKEINLLEWIKKYRERYDISEILNDNLSVVSVDQEDVFRDIDQSVLTSEFINFAKDNDYGFTNDEIDRLSLMINGKSREIKDLCRQVRVMRAEVLTIMQTQNINLDEDEIKNVEKEYVMETVISKMTGKKRSNKRIVNLIYATIIASLVLFPTLVKDEKNITVDDISYIEESQEEIDESTMMIDIIKEEDVKEEKEEEIEEYFDEDDEEEENKDVYVTEFKIGDTFHANIPYYISATSDQILGFLDDDVTVIGYFGVLEGDKGPVIFKKFRLQEDVDKFLRLYHGDHSDIHWRAAVASANNKRVKELLDKGEEVPLEETICFVDCIPLKQKELIRGK